jgi:hypothetical protein
MNGLDFILWENRRIFSFTYEMEKGKIDIAKKRLDTIAYIDSLNELIEE